MKTTAFITFFLKEALHLTQGRNDVLIKALVLLSTFRGLLVVISACHSFPSLGEASFGPKDWISAPHSLTDSDFLGQQAVGHMTQSDPIKVEPELFRGN